MKQSFVILFFLSFLSSLSAQPLNVSVSASFEYYMDSTEIPIPLVKPLFPYHIRDVAVCKGPSEKYYLTGTTDDNWGVAEGIRVWESTDLKNWTLLGGEDGFVWTFSEDARNEAMREIKVRNGRLMRGIWAPEIHYLKDNFWITYSVSAGYGSGLLRSTTGKAEGPYVDIDPEKALVRGIDATLFEDTDGSVWYIWGPGRMKKMNAAMSAFADEDEPIYPKDASGRKVGYEGVNIYFKNGTYYLMAAEWNAEGPQNGHLLRSTNENRRAADGRYDCMIATADQLAGPYSEAYIAVPHGGHNLIFDDFAGNTWATMFGNDEAAAPFREQAAVVPLRFDDDGRVLPKLPFPLAATTAMPVLYVSPDGDDTYGNSWSTAFQDLQTAIDYARPGTQIWVAKGRYAPVQITGARGLYIYGGFSGHEQSLTDRDPALHESILDGKKQAPHVVRISDSDYLRLDGLVITGGRASGQGRTARGGGIHLTGGGESVRVVNCTIRDNFALEYGGGLYATDGAGPTFIGCILAGNEAQENGGAVYVACNEDNGYHTRFYNCDMDGNRAQANGGVAYFTTDLKQTGTLRFINCLIRNNFTLLEAGNIVLRGGASLLMSHCTVVDNRGMSNGAAVATLGNVPGQTRIVNSIFSGNEGNVLFKAGAFAGADPITGFEQQWTNLLNNLFHNNQTLGICGYTYQAKRYENVDDVNTTSWGSDNLQIDPLFLNPAAGDFRLQANSPAIRKGRADNYFPIDCKGQRRIVNMDQPEHTVDLGWDQRSK